MFRKFAVGLCAAAAIAVLGSTTVKADKPDGILCTIETPKGSFVVAFPIPPKGGNMGDAVRMCLDKGGHPSGVYTGKPPVDEGPKK